MVTLPVTQLHVIAIYVSDLDGACAWYQTHLGLGDAGAMPPGRLLTGGGATLYLEAGHLSRPLDEPVAEIAPCFGLDSVRAGWEAARAAGLHILADYQEFAPTFAFFAIADPDGNRLEFAGNP